MNGDTLGQLRSDAHSTPHRHHRCLRVRFTRCAATPASGLQAQKRSTLRVRALRQSRRLHLFRPPRAYESPLFPLLLRPSVVKNCTDGLVAIHHHRTRQRQGRGAVRGPASKTGTCRWCCCKLDGRTRGEIPGAPRSQGAAYPYRAAYDCSGAGADFIHGQGWQIGTAAVGINTHVRGSDYCRPALASCRFSRYIRETGLRQ